MLLIIWLTTKNLRQRELSCQPNDTRPVRLYHGSPVCLCADIQLVAVSLCHDIFVFLMLTILAQDSVIF